MKDQFTLAIALRAVLLMLLAWVCWLPLATAQCDLTIVPDTLQADYTGSPVGFCVDLEYSVALRSERFLDGVRQTDLAEGCDYDTLTYYPYSTFPDAGANGPYELVSWLVNGVDYSGSFNTIAELVTLINDRDPQGFWIDDQLTRNLVGGQSGANYGPMRVRQVATGITRTITPNFQAIAFGTLVVADGAGLHEYVVNDPVSGCIDTLIIALVPRINDEAFDVFTDFETTSPVFCLDNTALLGNPQAYTLCNAGPANGTLNDIGNYCFTYTPNAGFSGSDPICFEVCDDSNPPIGPLCQRTTVDVITLAPGTVVRDTLSVRISASDTTVCLTGVIDVPSPYDVAQLCSPPATGLTALVQLDGCVSLQPDPGYSGQQDVCVVYCSAGTCDTTILQVEVLPDCSLGMFANNADTIASQGNPTPYCIGVTSDVLSGYELRIDGVLYTGPYAPCDIVEQHFYNYAPLVGNGSDGPYSLLSWLVDGQSTSGTFQGPAELEAIMRQFDPAGNWRLDTAAFSIQGGDPASTYGMMRIVHNASGTLSELQPNPIDVARGASIELPGDGSYDITVLDPISTCTDAVTVVVGSTDVGVTQTLFVNVDANSTGPLTCLFSAPRDTSFSCGDVSNGSVTIDANVCASYTPNAGFTGMDTLCYVSCDLPLPGVCDTTFVVYTVSPLTDTVFIDNFGDDPFTACATLPFPGPIAAPQFCGTTGPFVATASPADGCIVIDPADGFTGTGEVCVEFCQVANPTVCQRVIFIINQTPSCTPSLFAADTVRLPASMGSVAYCLADGADLSQFSIEVNGQAVTPRTDTTCGTTTGTGGGGMRDAYFYGTFLLPDVQYRIDAWDINGTLISGVLADNFAALADSMTAADPNLTWVYDVNLGGIVASAATGNYSSLFLFDPSFSSTTEVALQTIQVTDPGGGTFVPGAIVDLPTAGLYEVVVTANDGSCGDRLTIVREAANAPTRDTVQLAAQADQLNGPYCLDVSQLPGAPSSIASCGDPAQGSLTFTNLECFTYQPNPGYTGTDTACIVICTQNGLVCDTTIVVFTVTAPPTGCTDIWMETELEQLVTDCDVTTDVCLPDLPNGAFAYTLTVDGIVRTDAIACGADTLTIYSYADLAGQGQAGPYAVEDYRLGAQLFNSTVQGVNDLVDSLNQWDPNGNWMLNPGSFTIRGGVSGFAYDTLVLRQIATDTINRLVPVTTLRENQLGVSLDTGAHQIIVTETSTGCMDTLTYTLICATGTDCDDLQLLSDTLLTAMDCDGSVPFSVLSPTTDAGLLEIYLNGVLTSSLANGDTLVTFLDTGSYVLTVLDPIVNCANTYNVVVDCAPCGGILPDDISRAVNCAADEYVVCLPVTAFELADYDLFIDGVAYTDDFDDCDITSTFAIDVQDLPDAGQAGPYRLDSFRIGNEVFMADFNSPEGLADSLSIWDFSSTWTYDAVDEAIRGGSTQTTYSPLTITQIASGLTSVVQLSQVDLAAGVSIRLPSTQQSLVLTLDDGAGCSQTVDLELVCVSTETFTDTIATTESVVFCIDDSELTGPVVSLTNICPEPNSPVLFDFDAVLGCVTATGIVPGEVTACLVACDAAGVCDTTLYTVVVVNGDADIDAVDDAYRLVKGATIQRSLTANDTFGVLTSIRIVEQPARGTAFLDANGVLTYTPDQDQCGFIDTLVYEICEGTICDQATVTLRVRCELVEAYNGFSPNGDGINETFVIEGIEDFPEAEVIVYNRWGNEVLRETGYQNDWDGMWDGNRLVSGTYFYLIDLRNDEEPIAGYVQIWR